MAHVYILYSDKLGKYYTGSCYDLTKRLEEHKNKKFPNCFTTKDNNWKLFFDVPDLGYKQARSIERHIKNMKSSIYISNLLKYPEIIEKLKEKYA